jgi:hypothetical protein
MRRYEKVGEKSKSIFVGIDLHRLRWQVTIRTEDVELFSGSIPGRWEALQRLLGRNSSYLNFVRYETSVFNWVIFSLLPVYTVITEDCPCL